MPYDEALAARVRELLLDRPGYGERKMFGGICFLIGGHMCCGVAKGDLMVRVGPEAYAAALKRPHARPMDFTGRPLTGMVFVSRAGTARRAALAAWVERGADHAASLPPKKAPRKPASKLPSRRPPRRA